MISNKFQFFLEERYVVHILHKIVEVELDKIFRQIGRQNIGLADLISADVSDVEIGRLVRVTQILV